LKTTSGPAAGDFGCGQGGEFRASPQRAVRNEPTPATDKRPAARRVFAPKAVWLRCSSIEDPPGVFSFVAPCHPAFGAKTGPLVVFKQALREVSMIDGVKQEIADCKRNFAGRLRWSFVNAVKVIAVSQHQSLLSVFLKGDGGWQNIE